MDLASDRRAIAYSQLLRFQADVARYIFRMWGGLQSIVPWNQAFAGRLHFRVAHPFQHA